MLLKSRDALRQLCICVVIQPQLMLQLCPCTLYAHTPSVFIMSAKLSVGLVFTGFRDTEALCCEGDNSQCEGAERDSQ